MMIKIPEFPSEDFSESGNSGSSNLYILKMAGLKKTTFFYGIKPDMVYSVVYGMNFCFMSSGLFLYSENR